jgi:Protein of unknown function (DUF2975)
MTRTPSNPRLAFRAGMVTLLGIVLFTCLAAIVTQTVSFVGQILGGTTFVTLRARPEGWPFGIAGPAGVPADGHETALTFAVTGLSTGANVICNAAIVLGILAWAVVGLAALNLLRAIRRGRPFERGIVRQVAIAGIALLVLGTATQLVGWWASNAVIDEFGVNNNAWVYLRDLDFQPLTLAVGLTLLLAALAFHAGTRLQRDVEGLV